MNIVYDNDVAYVISTDDTYDVYVALDDDPVPYFVNSFDDLDDAIDNADDVYNDMVMDY